MLAEQKNPNDRTCIGFHSAAEKGKNTFVDNSAGTSKSIGSIKFVKATQLDDTTESMVFKPDSEVCHNRGKKGLGFQQPSVIKNKPLPQKFDRRQTIKQPQVQYMPKRRWVRRSHTHTEHNRYNTHCLCCYRYGHYATECWYNPYLQNPKAHAPRIKKAKVMPRTTNPSGPKMIWVPKLK